MKIRIKGNSLRVRLSRPEVNKLAVEGYLEDQVSFGKTRLVYALKTNEQVDRLSADFAENKITMYVASALIKEWPFNEIVGFDASMPLSDTDSLHLLLEKDFVCIEATAEDQTDHYENPNKTC